MRNVNIYKKQHFDENPIHFIVAKVKKKINSPFNPIQFFKKVAQRLIYLKNKTKPFSFNFLSNFGVK